MLKIRSDANNGDGEGEGERRAKCQEPGNRAAEGEGALRWTVSVRFSEAVWGGQAAGVGISPG